MHICVSKLTIIGSDNGLSPERHQAIIWTNGGILLIWPLGTNFSEISIDIHTFSFKKIHFKMSSGKWQPFCLGLNVLMAYARRAPMMTCALDPQEHIQLTFGSNYRIIMSRKCSKNVSNFVQASMSSIIALVRYKKQNIQDICLQILCRLTKGNTHLTFGG